MYLINFLLLSLLLTFSSFSAAANQPHTPTIDKGVINFSEWDHNRKSVFSLRGKWRFFKDRHIQPDELSRALQEDAALRAIPDLWSVPQNIYDDYRYTAKGLATYVLTFENLPKHEDVAILFNRICSAANIYLVSDDGEDIIPVREIGHAGLDIDTTIPKIKPVIVPLDLLQGKINHLLIQVSNFHLRDGGICDAVEFGTLQGITASQNRSIATAALTIGILLGVAIYCLGLMIQGADSTTSKSLLKVSIAAIAFFLSSESLLEIIAPGSPELIFELHHKLNYLGILFFAPAVYKLCLAALRRQDTPINKYAGYAVWGFAAFVLFFSTEDFTLFAPVLGIIFFYYILISLRTAYRAVQFNEPGSLWLLVGTGALAIAMLLQPFSSHIHTQANLALQFGILIFVFLQSQFVGLRFSTAMRESRFLSEHLQNEIGRKTRDLQNQQKEILAMRSEIATTSIVDKLTGIYSRGYFDNQVEIEWQRCRREQAPISFLLFDLDKSKSVNEQYGRDAGDASLHAFAQLLQKHTHRPNDICARYGGDEFIMLLPECETEDALATANAVLQAIEETPVTYGQHQITLHSSVGVSCTVPDEFATVTEELINHAVVALYQAKREARGHAIAYQAHMSQ